METSDSDGNDTFAVVPFWDPNLKTEYDKCWSVSNENVRETSFSTQNWFHHTKSEPIVTKTYDLRNKISTSDTKQKKKTKKKNIGSNLVLKENEIYRTRKIRMYPTQDQKLLLQKWFSACRKTYNWGLYKITVKRQCGFKVRYDRNSIRNLVVPKKVIPKHNSEYSWLLQIPKGIREQAAFELSDAHMNMFQKWKTTGRASNIKFRSVKDGTQSLTVSKTGFSKHQEDKTISIYPTFMKAPIRLRENISMTDIAMKISYTRSGKYYLHSVYIKEKIPIENGNICAIDPGVKPFVAYYSPNSKNEHAGFIGTDVDVETILKYGFKADKISSLLSEYSLNHRKRWKLRRKRFKLNSKIRNLVEEMLNYTCDYMCNTFGIIILPSFPVRSLIKKSDRRITSKTVRSMLSWRHGSFRTKMTNKVEIYGNELRIVGEAFTSKCCGECGNIKYNLGRNMVYRCSACLKTMDRQLNGSRNIYLKDIVNFM